MPNTMQRLMENIDNRVIRERVLIFLSLLAVTFLLWNFLLQSRFDNQRAALEMEAQRISSEQKLLESRITELTLSMANDPAIMKKTEITALDQRITDVETQLSGLSQGLISVAQLPKALEDVLQKTSAIKVLQVRTLPVDELRLAEQATISGSTANASEKGVGTGVYKHAVLIRVSGNYGELVQLIRQIESLPWRIYWESLDYRVTAYPDATVDIRVFTLSSEEGLLGV